MTDTYLWRKSAFSKGLIELRLSGDGVTEVRQGQVVTLPFEQITAVRVTYAPTRLKLNRHILQVEGRGGSITMESTHYEGVGRFSDQSASFSAFVDNFLEALSRRQPNLSVHVGAPTLSYVAQLLFVIVVYAVLGFVIMMLPLGGASWSSFIKLGIILVLMPVLFRWAVRARPRRVPISSVPRNYLPA